MVGAWHGKVVRAAVDRGLQVVGQVHTHPGDAYHSDGDNAGARIAFTGYVSIVLPDYGRDLPALTRAAAYSSRRARGSRRSAPPDHHRAGEDRMKDEDYYDARDDRLFRYPEARRLDQTRCIAIRAAPEYLGLCQVALLTAANLLGRMRGGSRSTSLRPAWSRPCPGRPMRSPDLPADRCERPIRGVSYLSALRMRTDHVVFLGPSGALMVTHGVGWLAYHGPAPSPLPVDNSANPVGAALAVIAAAAQLAAHGFGAPRSSILLNGFDWSHEVGAALPAPPTGAVRRAMGGRHWFRRSGDPLLPGARDAEFLRAAVRPRHGEARERHPLSRFCRWRYRHQQGGSGGPLPESVRGGRRGS